MKNKRTDKKKLRVVVFIPPLFHAIRKRILYTEKVWEIIE